MAIDNDDYEDYNTASESMSCSKCPCCTDPLTEINSVATGLVASTKEAATATVALSVADAEFKGESLKHMDKDLEIRALQAETDVLNMCLVKILKVRCDASWAQLSAQLFLGTPTPNSHLRVAS